LKPTPAVDSGARSIKEKAQELTIGQVKITDKAESLFYFVRDEIKYSPSSPRYFLNHFSQINLRNDSHFEIGICLGFSA
jgi:transglutaminase-like putative cysteine protease